MIDLGTRYQIKETEKNTWEDVSEKTRKNQMVCRCCIDFLMG
jgi:hypothetical protein